MNTMQWQCRMTLHFSCSKTGVRLNFFRGWSWIIFLGVSVSGLMLLTQWSHCNEWRGGIFYAVLMPVWTWPYWKEVINISCNSLKLHCQSLFKGVVTKTPNNFGITISGQILCCWSHHELKSINFQGIFSMLYLVLETEIVSHRLVYVKANLSIISKVFTKRPSPSVMYLWWHWWRHSWQRIPQSLNLSQTQIAGSAGCQYWWWMEALNAHSTCT